MITDVSIDTVDVAKRVLALRKALGLTQDQLADRAAEPTWTRPVIANIENGKNKMSTWPARTILARAFGATVNDMAAYLDGVIGIDEMRARITAARQSPTTAIDPGQSRALPSTAIGQHPQWPAVRAEVAARFRKTIDPDVLDEVAGASFSNMPRTLTAEFVKQVHDALVLAKESDG